MYKILLSYNQEENNMAHTPEHYSLGRETYAIYTGQSTPAFAPSMAGITYPDPSYEIERPYGEFYVFEYVISGRGHICQAENAFEAEPGDAYLLRAGEYHHYYADKKDPWEKIWFNVGGSLVRHLLSDYGLDRTMKIPAFGNARQLTAIFHTIEKEPVHCSEELALLLHQYIQELSAFLGDQTADHSQALAMKNYIEQNLTLPLTIEEIAAQVHLSRSRAIHLFREAYGTTPYNYYLEQKLALSRTMLLRTSLSIQEISERLGFSDYHHFSGTFKKMYGVSPSRYRKT